MGVYPHEVNPPPLLGKVQEWVKVSMLAKGGRLFRVECRLRNSASLQQIEEAAERKRERDKRL